jgi:hypothetical protein
LPAQTHALPHVDQPPAQATPLDHECFAMTVVEVNPYHPRPFVFTDGARCIVASLQDLGVRARHLANAIPAQGGMILMGWTPQWLAANSQHLDPARTFLFNAEQLGGGSSLLTPAYIEALGSWQVMDYHDANADYLRHLHGQKARVVTVPIIPGPAVCYAVPEPTPEATVDVLFYGTMNARREQVVSDLRQRGLSVEVVSGSYGEELTPALRRCRLVLHMHFYQSALFPILRLLQPVARGIPVVCETSVFSKWNDWSSSGMVFADYEELGQACEDLARDTARAESVARRCLEFAHELKMTEP